MKAALQRTPKDDMLRVRFRYVQFLLRATDLPIDAVAAQTGFNYGHYLQAAFREKFGLTPGAFRKKHRAQ